jgi:hypothetical protein
MRDELCQGYGLVGNLARLLGDTVELAETRPQVELANQCGVVCQVHLFGLPLGTAGILDLEIIDAS